MGRCVIFIKVAKELAAEAQTSASEAEARTPA